MQETGTTTVAHTPLSLAVEAKVPDSDQPKYPHNIRPLVQEYMQRHAQGKFPSQPCYRHKSANSPHRSADQNRATELRNEISSLQSCDAEVIQAVWQAFGAAPPQQRVLILKGLLNQCCFPQLSDVASLVRELVRMDILTTLPIELAFKVLGYLDAKSLLCAAQVSRSWRNLADDDVVWYHICEQHIDRKCTTCGWGLPLLDGRRLRRSKKAVMDRLESLSLQNMAERSGTGAVTGTDASADCSRKRTHDATSDELDPQRKIVAVSPVETRRTKPWKMVYFERFRIERNWRLGKHVIKEFPHISPVLCLQFDDRFLITGSHDGHVTIWDVETQKVVRTLNQHFRAVSALKFDDNKLVTGSWDQTVRVWNYQTGQCLCTFSSLEAKVLCLDVEKDLIVAGTAQGVIKAWDFGKKSCFTLRGHQGAVLSIHIHAASGTLYTSSSDLTVRMWDIKAKKCLKVFGGAQAGPDAHNGRIQQVLPMTLQHLEWDEDEGHHLDADAGTDASSEASADTADAAQLCRPTHLLTASLDNTVKVWDIKTGRCIKTLFGHVDGVWCMAADQFRVVSGSLDKQVKVWDLQSGKCRHTFSAHTKPVCCVGLTDTGFATGSEDGKVIMHNYDLDS